MSTPSPILILLNHFQLLENRKKKHIKLVILREKSLARRVEASRRQEEDNSDDMILWELNESNFSAITSEKEDNDDHDVPLPRSRATTVSHSMPLRREMRGTTQCGQLTLSASRK